MTTIAVIGQGICSAPLELLAEETGSLLARNGCVLVCGGLGGVMEAACRGARSAGGMTVGILPGASRMDANRFVTIPIATGLGEARNAVVVRSAQAVIAIGGEFGTLTEIAFALKFGLPVIGLRTWELAHPLGARVSILRVDTPEAAVHSALAAIGAP